MSDIYNIKTTNKYEDIIHLQHPTSANHPQMPIEDRAAQFSPFAALTGHEDAIRETQRRMEERFRGVLITLSKSTAMRHTIGRNRRALVIFFNLLLFIIYRHLRQ